MKSLGTLCRCLARHILCLQFPKTTILADCIYHFCIAPFNKNLQQRWFWQSAVRLRKVGVTSDPETAKAGLPGSGEVLDMGLVSAVQSFVGYVHVVAARAKILNRGFGCGMYSNKITCCVLGDAFEPRIWLLLSSSLRASRFRPQRVLGRLLVVG